MGVKINMARSVAPHYASKMPDFEPAEPEQPEETADQADDAELSAMRIHQISALRRGAYRTRSWLIIAAVVFLAGAAQLIYLAVHGFRLGQRIVPIGDLAAAVAALVVCPYFVRRALRVHREIHRSLIEEPTTPPDFSTLSDGSQRWKNLEAMADDQPD